jgi:hypothetical protein
MACGRWSLMVAVVAGSVVGLPTGLLAQASGGAGAAGGASASQPAAQAGAGEVKHNVLTPVEAVSGWRLLFDGSTPTGWRNYKQRALNAQAWPIQDNTLMHVAGAGGGDAVHRELWADFDLVFSFKLAPKANSGIIYRVLERPDATWMTGPEYQLLDDIGNDLKPGDPHGVGAMYDLYPPPADKPVKPAGEWNTGRIRLSQGVVKHFLNGRKLLEARLFDEQGKPTPEWAAKIAGSKFKAYEGFGVQPKGLIAVQDHGDEVALRDVKIRELPGKMPGEIQLFNGKDLSGWTPFIPDAKADAASVWSVRDGVLVCKGTPAGYLRTDADYRSYVLRLEWRWAPGEGANRNSGVLLRVNGPDKVWPRSVEAQLMSGSAGDFWNIENMAMTTDPARTKGRNTKKAVEGAERPIGEWNEYEIIVNKGEVTLIVNGEELNRATGVEGLAGKIALQSEGAEIHFRSIRLKPLD